MKEIKNNLPKYWVVKLLKKEQQLFRRTVIPYLNNVYSKTWRGSNINWFYGFDGNDLFNGNNLFNGTNTWKDVSHFENNPIVLTLQEFIELSKPIEEFELPNDWVLKVTSETVDVINKWKQTTKWKDHAKQYAYVRYDGAGTVSGDSIAYSEITFEQFKKHVAKTTVIETVKEDNFVLPERWCVEVTSVNDYKEYAEHMGYDLTYNWFRGMEGQSYYLFCDEYLRLTPAFVSSSSYEPLYTRITLEQFQNHILAPIKNKLKDADFIMPTTWSVEVNSSKQFENVVRYLIENYGFAAYHIESEPSKYPYYVGLSMNKQPYYNSTLRIDDHGPMISYKQFEANLLNKSKEVTIYSIEEVKTNPKIIVYLDSEEEWNQLCKAVGFKVVLNYKGKHCYSVVEKNWSTSSSQTDVGAYDKDCIIITLNQIKINMDKKIIGYKLIKSDYKEAALKICCTTANWENSLMPYDISISQSGYIKRLQEAGVLDLWFEPIYQVEEKFKVGDIVVVAEQQLDNRAKPGDIVKIIKVDDSDVPYKVTDFKGKYSNGSWCKSVRKATAEEIKSIKTNSFTFGDFNITVKEDRIVIEGRGNISMDDFNSVVVACEEITNGITLRDSEYSVNFNITAVNVGCVKNIPIEAITTINNYLKAIK